MKLKFLFFIFATFLVMETRAYVAFDVVPVNAAYPGKCFIEEHNMVLEFGKEYPVPRKCEQMICDQFVNRENKHTLSITGCGSVGILSSCKLSKVDLRKIYPACCPRQIC